MRHAHCGIYCITNMINGKKYIGKSVNIKRRWWEERARGRNPDTSRIMPIYSAIYKYGVENFKFDIIEECLPEELSKREQYWIESLHTLAPTGYNLLRADLKYTEPKRCPLCHKVIVSQANHCPECSHILQRKVERPDADTLQKLLYQYTFRKVGEMYGVSDKAIGKWCKAYNLAYKAKDYK